MAMVALRWHGTAILCGCGGGLCVHWSGSDSRGFLHQTSCGDVLGLHGRSRLSNLRGRGAFCVHNKFLASMIS